MNHISLSVQRGTDKCGVSLPDVEQTQFLWNKKGFTEPTKFPKIQKQNTDYLDLTFFQKKSYLYFTLSYYNDPRVQHTLPGIELLGVDCVSVTGGGPGAPIQASDTGTWNVTLLVGKEP